MHEVTKHNKQAPSYFSDKVAANADQQSRAGLRPACAKKYQYQGHVGLGLLFGE